MSTDPNGKIFVCYKKRFSTWQALSVYYSLESIHQRDIWMDKNLVPGNNWEKVIFAAIDSSPHFVLILSPGCLDETRKKRDFFGNEILHAIRTNRNIVPLFFDFDWKQESERVRSHNNYWYRIPKEIRGLSKTEGKTISLKGFAEEISQINRTSLVKPDKVNVKRIPKAVANTILETVVSQTPFDASNIEFANLPDDPKEAYSQELEKYYDLISNSKYSRSTTDFLEYEDKELRNWLAHNLNFLPPKGLVKSKEPNGDLGLEIIYKKGMI